MSDHTIRIELSLGARSLRCLMAAAMVFAAVSELASENITLTTYYPAPSGVYSQMITTGDTRLARDGGNVLIGSPSTRATLNVNGGAHISGTVATENALWVETPDGSINATINNDGSANFNGNVTVRGSGSFNGNVTAQGLIQSGTNGECNDFTKGAIKWDGAHLQVCAYNDWSFRKIAFLDELPAAPVSQPPPPPTVNLPPITYVPPPPSLIMPGPPLNIGGGPDCGYGGCNGF